MPLVFGFLDFEGRQFLRQVVGDNVVLVQARRIQRATARAGAPATGVVHRRPAEVATVAMTGSRRVCLAVVTHKWLEGMAADVVLGKRRLSRFPAVPHVAEPPKHFLVCQARPVAGSMGPAR